MKFVVSRTSGGMGAPCAGAYISKIVQFDIAKRENIPTDTWVVDITSIEKLIEFVKRNDIVVMKECVWNKDYCEIEIYDDYRE